ncbi:MAG: hypothetical protein ACJ8AW_47345 [Rhodopila sp.]
MTGGVPFLVRITIESADPADHHGEPAAPAKGPGDRLNSYAKRLAEGCGAAQLGIEAGAPLLARHALAVATLAGTLDINRFESISRSTMPETIANLLDGDTLHGIEPPLLALAFLQWIDRDGSAADRRRIAQRAWQEAPEGVARMIRHFWLSVAHDDKYAAMSDKAAGSALPDPAWFQPYDTLPEDATEAVIIAWFSAMLEVLLSRRLTPDDRAIIEARIAPLVETVSDNTESGMILWLWAKFLASRAVEGDRGAWDRLEALYTVHADPSGAVALAWAIAAPFVVQSIGTTDPTAALALADGILATDIALVTPFRRAQTAVALSALRADSVPDALERAVSVFAKLDDVVRSQTDITAMECGLAVNATRDYGAAQRWDEMARWLATLSDVAGRFPENPDIQLELARGAINATSDYGKAQRWDEMARWLATLSDVAGRFPENPDIQLRLARGAAAAVQSASMPIRLRQKALALLADVSRRHPGHLQIQAIAQEFGVTIADQMTHALAALQSKSHAGAARNS